MGNKNITKYATFRGHAWSELADLPKESLHHGVIKAFGYNRTAGNNARYKALIRAGVYAGNGMTITVSNGESTDLHSVVYVRKSPEPTSPDYTKIGTYGFDGVHSSMMPLVLTAHSGSSSMATARSIAKRALTRQTTKRRTQFQGGVFFGELGKSALMVAKPAKSLRTKTATFISRLRKLRKRRQDNRSWAKVVADTWLEAAFGWRPLISEVQDGATAIARMAQKDALERRQFRAFGEAEVPVQSTNNGVTITCGSGSKHIHFQVYRSLTRRDQCIIYGAWHTKLRNPVEANFYASRLATLSGFNWVDVLPQAWELAPWSFLVDYFTNVGDVLEACANIYEAPAWAAEVQITETEEIRKYVPDAVTTKSLVGPTFVYLDGGGSVAKMSYRTISRGVSDWDLRPSISLRLPSHHTQWLNIAALIAGGKSFQPFLKR